MVREHRLAAGLTQRQLAEAAGVSIGVVRDIEQGRTARLRARSAGRLSSVLGLDATAAGELARLAGGGEAVRPVVTSDASPVTGILAGTRLCILGPLTAWRQGVMLDTGPPAQRAVLGLLALSPNQVVQRAAIIDALWADDPPASAVNQVQKYTGRLRQILDPQRASRDQDRLLTPAGAGYRLQLSADQLDLLEFDTLVRLAGSASDVDAALDRYEQALGLWCGDPVADVDALRGFPAVTGLTQRWSGAIIAHAEICCAERRYERALSRLQSLTQRDPLHERAHALLVIALAGTGRRDAAFTVFDELRRRLRDELGVGPGRILADAYDRVLGGEIPPADGSIGLALPRANGQDRAGPDPVPVPRQLPAAAADFTGRAAEVAALTRMLDDARAGRPGTVVISAIGGTAGVGKTALALHWAHQIAGRFRDGQLHVNLRGFDSSGTPVTPAEAIRGFLDALGVPPERIPASPGAQAGLYRSLLADKRMLIVADNARDEQQVRPLLPASPGSLVLVTSRSQLSGLAAADGARMISLDVLTHAEAVRMLTARLGADRATAQPGAVGQIASLCACLPLALAVAAARAASRPGFPLAALAAELTDSAGRLDALDGGDPASSVRAVFSWSYRQLSTETARMFRLLGLHPGPDICVPAAAGLAGRTQPQARALLRELARAHLIAEHVPGRFSFHDLLRAYAAAQARDTDRNADRDAATGRVLDHYLHTAARASCLFHPAFEPVVLAPPRPGSLPGQPADHRQAMAWFETEHQVLLAAVTLAAGSGFGSHAWQLPWAMAPFLRTRGHYQEWAAIQRTALAAATRLGDTAAQALSGRLLASACINLGDHDLARGHFTSSLTLYQRLGNRLGEGITHQNLGVLANRQGRYADALGHAEQALRLYQAIGDKTSEAEALNNVGWCHGLLGDFRQARAFCRQALTLCAETGDRRLEGHAWDSLGYAEHQLGNLTDAAACYQRALGLHRESGYRLAEAEALTHLGEARHGAGEVAQAREAWQQALAILLDLQHPDAGKVRARLASCPVGAAVEQTPPGCGPAGPAG